MNTDKPTKTQKSSRKSQNGKYKLLGYRAVVREVPLDSIKESSLWIPDEAGHKFRAARVLQCGKYTVTKKRPPMEFETGNLVLIDRNYNSQPISDDDGSPLLIVSAHDVVAVIG